MSLSEAIEIVGKMLQGYPNGRDVPDSYIGALASVLAQYPRCVTTFAGDPHKGVPRETRFLPTPADVVAWCEREVADLRGIVARDDYHRSIREKMQRLASEEKALAEARKTRPTLQQMQEKHGPTWGIGVAEKQDLIVKAARDETMREANARAFAAECRAAGIDQASTISPTLTRLIEEQNEKLALRYEEQEHAA